MHVEGDVQCTYMLYVGTPTLTSVTCLHTSSTHTRSTPQTRTQLQNHVLKHGVRHMVIGTYTRPPHTTRRT